MSESATRDVIFRMKAERDQSAIPNLEKFGKSIERIQSTAIGNVDRLRAESLSRFNKASRDMVASERRASAEIEKLIRGRIALRQRELSTATSGKAAGTGESGTVAAVGRPRAESHREDGKAAVAAHRAAVTAIRAEVKESNGLTRSITDRIKLREREARTAETTSRLTERTVDRETDAVKRELTERDKLQAGHQKRQLQRQQALAIEMRKTRQQQTKEAEKSFKATEKEMAQVTGRLNAGNALLQEGLTSAGESLVRMSTGLATIGLLNEENNEKLLRGLVLMRGINDSVAGGINLWVRTGKLVEGYRTTLEAAKAAQAVIIAQQNLMGPGVPVAGKRRAVGAVADAAGDVAAGAVGGRVAAAGAGAAAGQLTALQRASLAAGRGLSSVGSVASKAAPALGRLLGVLAAGDVLVSLGTTGGIGPRRGSVREGAVQSAGGMIGSASGFAAGMLPESVLRGLSSAGRMAPQVVSDITGGDIAQAELDRRKSDRMQGTRDKRLEKEAQQRFMVSQKLERTAFDAESKVRAAMSAIDTARGPGKLQAIDQAREEVGRQQATVQAVNVGGGADDAEQRIDKLEVLSALDERAVELAKMRQAEEVSILQTKKEAATVAIDASREELSNAQATLASTKNRIEATKQALMSAEIRFAQMDRKSQEQLLALSKKAQAGGKLSREERDVLLQKGIGRSRDIAQQQAVDEARRLGFRKVEGADLRQQLAKDQKIVERQQKIIQRVQTEIEIREEFVVSLDESVRNVREMILEEVRRANERERQIDRAQLDAIRSEQVRSANLRRSNTS